MSETVLVRRILLAIGSRRDCRVWRNNTGSAFVPLTPSGREALRALAARGEVRPVQYGVTGQADISGILNTGQRLELEVKSNTGRLSTEQADFGKMVVLMGGVWSEVRSEADAVEVVEAKCRTT